MRAVDIIMKKRGSILNPCGEELSKEELNFLISGYVAGEIPDYQVSALLMAVYFNGMTFAETAAFTDVMLHSGEIIDLSSLPGIKVDKHSTGGVGDKISLPLAPLAAACGVTVPMMSGRALGHTGGTLDKLESIDGYRVSLSQDEFRTILKKTGYAMTGQTKSIVPADRLLYALRDVTGTVESVPLITASILSKKVAEGSDCLVFDIKYGSGAFMKTKEAAESLADSLAKTARAMDKKAVSLITRMTTPLGRKIGNFLEIEETVDCLTWNASEGKSAGPDDVMELVYAMGAWMTVLAGKAKNAAEGRILCENAIKDGSALRLFYENAAAQGGNPEKLRSELGKRRSTFRCELCAKEDGYLIIDAYKTGLAGVHLGVGRNKTGEAVSADAGVILHSIEGKAVRKGDLIMEVFGKNDECFLSAMPILKDAVTYAKEKSTEQKLIFKEITAL